MMKTYTIRAVTKAGKPLETFEIEATYASDALARFERFMLRQYLTIHDIQRIDIDVKEE